MKCLSQCPELSLYDLYVCSLAGVVKLHGQGRQGIVRISAQAHKSLQYRLTEDHPGLIFLCACLVCSLSHFLVSLHGQNESSSEIFCPNMFSLSTVCGFPQDIPFNWSLESPKSITSHSQKRFFFYFYV